MNRLPWFKFYPADWRKDPELGSVSVAARGLWIELMAIMHECAPPGVAMLGGVPATNRQIAQLSRVAEADVDRLLGELLTAKVAERRPDGAIFCRRMFREGETRVKMSDGANKRLTKAIRSDRGRFTVQGATECKSQNKSQEENRSLSVGSPTDDGGSLRSAGCAAPLAASTGPETPPTPAVPPAPAAATPKKPPLDPGLNAWWAEWWAATEGLTAEPCYNLATGQREPARPGRPAERIASAYAEAAARVGDEAVLAATRRVIATGLRLPTPVRYLEGL